MLRYSSTLDWENVGYRVGERSFKKEGEKEGESGLEGEGEKL